MNLDEVLVYMGWNQTDLADTVGVSRQAIVMWKVRHGGIPWQYAYKLVYMFPKLKPFLDKELK